jgi:hypothetical protein
MRHRYLTSYANERAQGWDPGAAEACYQSIVLSRGSKRLGLVVLAMRGDPPVPWREVHETLLQEIAQSQREARRTRTSANLIRTKP